MKVCCPRCGHGLVIEAFGQYGLIRKVSENGKIGKRAVKALYELDGASEELVYCPSCRWNADGAFSSDGEYIAPDWSE